MAMKLQCVLLVLIALLPAACRAEPIHASYCAVVTIPHWDTSGLIQGMDAFAKLHGLERGAPQQNGIVYGSPDKSFLVNVLAYRKDRAEIALFPRSADGVSDH
ncbi:MAG: hypothetical protein EOP14_04415 [Pseudomonas sp.]|nr:MAG: hypothetical protein EOP14_04415 [Pseudomonas sp.]